MDIAAKNAQHKQVSAGSEGDLRRFTLFRHVFDIPEIIVLIVLPRLGETTIYGLKLLYPPLQMSYGE